MSRRKDHERFARLKQHNPEYVGFRGAGTITAKAQAPLESAICSVCNRKRNVPSDSVPEDRGSYVCARCQANAANTSIN